MILENFDIWAPSKNSCFLVCICPKKRLKTPYGWNHQSRMRWFWFLKRPIHNFLSGCRFPFFRQLPLLPRHRLEQVSRNRDLRQMVRFRIAASASIGTSWKKQPDDEENSRKMMKRIWEWVHGWTESKEDVSIEFGHFSKIFKNWERTSFPNVLQTKMRLDLLIKNVLNLIFFEALTTRQTYFDHIDPITI